jgi:hypothetical protein
MPYTGTLDKIESITVEPDGRVGVCNEFFIGSAAQREVLEILENYDPYQVPEMSALLEGGVDRLAELLRAGGIQLDPGGYYSVCDMCASLRRAQKETAC